VNLNSNQPQAGKRKNAHARPRLHRRDAGGGVRPSRSPAHGSRARKRGASHDVGIDVDTLRESGIEVVGAVPWGTHFCQFYQTSQDLVETLVPYFREGLAAREFCMWVTSPPLQVEEAKAALRAALPDLDDYIARGQIEILDYADWYLKSGEFRADEVLQGWVDKHDDALRRGYEGLRLSGNTFWLEQTSWADFAQYEEKVNNVIGRYRMLAICTYSLEKCGALEIAEVIATHQFALIKRSGRWQIVESSRHRLTESALRESEQRLRSTLESITDGFVAIDREWRYTYVNDAALANLGKTRDELIGRSMWEVFPEAVGTVFWDKYHEAMEKQTPVEFEACYEPYGIWHYVKAYPSQDGLTLYVRDITERKRAEDMLGKSEEELRKLNRTLKALSDSDQAMMRARNEPDYLNEICRIIVEDCGHSMVWIGFAEENDAETVRPVAQAGFEEGYLQTVNITWADTERGRGPTGTAIRTGKPAICRNMLTDPSFAPWREEATRRGYASSIVLPLTIGGKTFGAINIYSKDPDPFSEREVQLLSELADDLAYGITAIRLREEHAKAEEAIERERQRLQALVETSPVGIVLVDAEGRPLLVNREAERIFGYSRVEGDSGWYDRAVRRRPDGSVYTRAELPLERALRRGETVRAEEVWFYLPDGRTVPTLTNATPVYGASGEIAGAIAIIQDMTPLEEVEKVRSEFLGMVTHELKTPLTAIKGSAATALGSSRPLDAAQLRELFEIINGQADRLRELVDDLLDMTRIEAGSLSIDPEPLDLRTVVEETLATFFRTVGLREVRLELPDALPLVKADRGRIGQVMTNLLTNAAKFSPSEAPITISAEQDPLSVTVHVRDEGRGIAREKLPLLFKKFSRLHEDNRQNLSSTGLGLAISKGIVEAHGGRIWADSAGEGQGTTFSFSLPIAVQEASAAAAGIERGAVQVRKVTRPGKRARVLAVDDEPHILRYLQRSLSEAGYQAIVTGDPSQVAGLVELEEPDLVVLDLRLPGISGFDLLQRIRELSAVPVIFLTASDREEDAVQALKAGADDYITKPFSPSELLARIEAVLRRRAATGPMETRRSLMLEDLAINFAEREVTLAGRPVSLTATEYKLLYELATHAGRVLTYDQILQRVWGPEYSGETELVRSFVRNLRRKLGDDAYNPRFILTERQVGYRMPKPQA
jgi:PAS domain S-box-containing protein